MDIPDALKQRRSIQFFDPKRDIPKEDLMHILELANLTPSSMNLQPWELIIVASPKQKEKLRKAAFDQPKVTEASLTAIVIADPASVEKNLPEAIRSWLELGYFEEDKQPFYENMAQSLYDKIDSPKRTLFAVKNSAFFAMSLMVAAQQFGVETHPMDGFDEEQIKKDFCIPEDRKIPLIIAMGYPHPDLHLLPRAFRRSISSFVFNEYYEKIEE